jgi:hypothetical protein
LLLPIAPVHSGLWNVTASINNDVKEELGWRLMETVAKIRDTLSIDECLHLGIFAGDYGEAGAINLFPARLRQSATGDSHCARRIQFAQQLLGSHF